MMNPASNVLITNRLVDDRGYCDRIAYRYLSQLATAGVTGILNVKDFGAVGDGTTDDTAAIDAADAAACDGSLGLDGATVVAQALVYFPAGTYKHTGLTYRGAPWLGEGVNVTTLRYYGSGASVDAVGAIPAQKLVNIAGMMIYGGDASTGAYGLKLGYNQRSLGALRQVRVQGFPSYGIYFAQNTFIMSFEDVAIVFCGNRDSTTGIGMDPSLTGLAAMDWHNLCLEHNGNISSGVAGGLDLRNLNRWGFYGGTIEGNFGDAELRVTDSIEVGFFGTYFEGGINDAIDGLIFAGSTTAALYGPSLASSTATGSGVRALGTSRVHLSNPYWVVGWLNQISVEDTAQVSLIPAGNTDMTLVTLAAGANLVRVDGTTVQVTGLPTSNAGLPAGSFWNSGGTVHIV